MSPVSSAESSGFASIVSALREEVLAWYERHGQSLEGEAGRNTLETNSGYVERRGDPLLAMLGERLGGRSLEGLSVLDLGCGFGALSAFFAAHGAQVTGVDPNVSRFEVGAAVARRHELPIRFVAGRMERLPLPDGAFDLAVQNNSLCYLTGRGERALALAETLRVLRPGGVLIGRNPNRWHPLDQFTRLPLVHLLPPAPAAALSARLGRERSAALAVSPLRLRRELRRAGFEDVVQHGFVDSSRPDALKLVARYHHLSARRPAPNAGGAPV
jgi:SAM-dependent methyltransferase